MATTLTIPEWQGSGLTHAEFLEYGDKTLAAYVAVGLEDINLTAIGMQLTAALDDLRKAVRRQSAYDETVALSRADANRDACFKALWHAWSFLGGVDSTHPFAAHVETLRSEMQAYKGVWSHKLDKETAELNGFRGALSTEANQAALAALGLDKIAAALWVANEAADAAQDARDDERGSRADEKAAGTTPELRKAVANLLVKAAKRVNSVYDIDPDNAKAEQVIVKVCGIVEHYKLAASEAKHRKGGDEPEPEPEPTPEPEPAPETN